MQCFVISVFFFGYYFHQTGVVNYFRQYLIYHLVLRGAAQYIEVIRASCFTTFVCWCWQSADFVIYLCYPLCLSKIFCKLAWYKLELPFLSLSNKYLSITFLLLLNFRGTPVGILYLKLLWRPDMNMILAVNKNSYFNMLFVFTRFGPELWCKIFATYQLDIINKLMLCSDFLCTLEPNKIISFQISIGCVS